MLCEKNTIGYIRNHNVFPARSCTFIMNRDHRAANKTGSFKTLLALILVFFSVNLGAQQTDNTDQRVNLTTIAEVNQTNNYITFPINIGNMAPLWFEANVVPNFYIRKSKNARLMGVLTPQIIIRMYQEESFPVRTPSYIPQISVYYSLTKDYINHQNTLFGRIAHHSNGQSGSFFLPDGEINHLDGNFSTNFVQLGIMHNRFNNKVNAAQFFSTSVEVHPPGWSMEELDNQYSMVRWQNAFSIYKIPIGHSSQDQKSPSISLKAEMMWMFGQINSWEEFSSNRLNLNFILYYHPKFFEDIGFFVEVFSGMDYYNIYFDEKVEVLRFGIMTEKLRF